MKAKTLLTILMLIIFSYISTTEAIVTCSGLPDSLKEVEAEEVYPDIDINSDVSDHDIVDEFFEEKKLRSLVVDTSEKVMDAAVWPVIQSNDGKICFNCVLGGKNSNYYVVFGQGVPQKADCQMDFDHCGDDKKVNAVMIDTNNITKVRKGHTLSQIGNIVGIDYRLLVAYNSIDKPGSIKPGQEIYLPDSADIEELKKDLAEKQNGTKSVRSENSSNLPFIPEDDSWGTFDKDNYVWKTYAVKKGETLYGVALKNKVSWLALAWMNDLDVNAELNTGDQLKIPYPQFFYWRYIGGRPFGMNDPFKIFPRFEFAKTHPQVIDLLRIKINREEFEPDMIMPGQFISQMIYDSVNHTIKSNVVYVAATPLPGQAYEIYLHDEDSILVVFRPDVCFNWCWWKIAKPPVIVKPPEEEYPDPPKEDIPDEPEIPEEPYTPVEERLAEKTKPYLISDYWVNHDFPFYKPFRLGGNSLGLKLSLLFQSGDNFVGFHGMIPFWAGESRDGFYYWGISPIGGLTVIFNAKKTTATIDIGYGYQWDWGRLPDTDYKSTQGSHFIRPAMVLDARGDKVHFFLSAEGKISFNEAKNSHSNGTQLIESEDPAYSKSMVMLDLKWLFGKKKVHPGFYVSEIHSFEDWSWTSSAGALLGFNQDRNILGLGCKNRAASRWRKSANGNAIIVFLLGKFGSGVKKADEDKEDGGW